MVPAFENLFMWRITIYLHGRTRDPAMGTNRTLRAVLYILFLMQGEEQHSTLSRRRRYLMVYMTLQNDDDDFENSIVVLSELRRLDEQMELQRLARINICTSLCNINALSDLQCLQRYRFRRNDVGFIAGLIPLENGLDSEGKMRTSQKQYLVDPMESTAIMLRRLATPSWWIDVQIEFGKHRSALSEIFHHTLELFYGEFGSYLTNWPHGLVDSRARDYAKAVFEKGSPFYSVVGFIDGTPIDIKRPSGARQRATYSGQKRSNCLKFQAVSAPDGSILHLFGPNGWMLT
jgi:DDE superfamily endonuclease